MFLSQKGYIQNTLNVYSWNNIDGQKTYFRGIFREAGGGRRTLLKFEGFWEISE